MTGEEKRARELVQSIFDKRYTLDRVSPTWLATEAMQTLDPERVSHPIEYAMAHLQFRQIARSICANTFERPDDPNVEDQHELFPVLQRMYPTARSSSNEEPEYVRLELLTNEDVLFNVKRLRREAVTKLKHADALEAWAASRRNAA